MATVTYRYGGSQGKNYKLRVGDDGLVVRTRDRGTLGRTAISARARKRCKNTSGYTGSLRPVSKCSARGATGRFATRCIQCWAARMACALPGACGATHNRIRADQVARVRSAYLGAPVVVHPECPPRGV